MGKSDFRYNAPMTQVAILGVVCFCTVGMFASAMDMGAGGTSDVVLADLSNVVLYVCFILTGLVAGAITNILGPRVAIFIGSSGYALFVGAMWNYQVNGTRWFAIFAGAVLGCSGAILWAAQGAIMMSYPSKEDRGRAFSVFYALLMAGPIIGCSASLGINAGSKEAGVSTAVYLAFLIIIGFGAAASWAILPPHLVVRSDGSPVHPIKSSKLSTEIFELLALFKDRTMLSLAPFAFSINLSYGYHGVLNTTLFNGRTRTLNGVLAGAAPLFGAVFIGFVHDKLPFKLRTRAMVGLGVVTAILLVCFSSTVAFHVHNDFTRASIAPHWDWTDRQAPPPILMLMAFWLCDSLMQGSAYFIMASTTNDPFKLARMASFYKSIDSVGVAVSFGLDAGKIPYLAQAIISWLPGLLSVPLVMTLIRTFKDETDKVEGEVPLAAVLVDDKVAPSLDQSDVKLV